MTGAFENVRSQLFRRRLSGAAGDRYNGLAPGRIHTMCELLKCSDSVFNQQQVILHLLQIRITIYTIRTRDSGNCTTFKRVANKAMRIDKLSVKTGAGVVLLRERKEQFARAYRT